jgi:predicted secreted protein
MSYREAILKGTKAAAKLHEQFESSQPIETHRRGSIDVFGSILTQGVNLVFRPLDGLLGACLDGRGIIISTNRPLSVQRFTGGHELGHVVLEHEFSMDGEEILTGDFPSDKKVIEVEANAFAGEFLLPRWLLAHHAKRQGWDAKSMGKPDCVYQLSLRVGASYEATIWSLERNQIIDTSSRQELLRWTPKTIKQQLLRDHVPENWYRDVWLITEKDAAGVLEGQPDDVFVFRLNEKSGAGYLWDLEMAKKNGFQILSDKRDDEKTDDNAVGSAVTRVITMHSPSDPKGRLQLSLRRPWQRSGIAAERLEIEYNLLGKEVGLPRALRPQLATAA